MVQQRQKVSRGHAGARRERVAQRPGAGVAVDQHRAAAACARERRGKQCRDHGLADPGTRGHHPNGGAAPQPHRADSGVQAPLRAAVGPDPLESLPQPAGGLSLHAPAAPAQLPQQRTCPLPSRQRRRARLRVRLGSPARAPRQGASGPAGRVRHWTRRGGLLDELEDGAVGDPAGGQGAIRRQRGAVQAQQRQLRRPRPRGRHRRRRHGGVARPACRGELSQMRQKRSDGHVRGHGQIAPDTGGDDGDQQPRHGLVTAPARGPAAGAQARRRPEPGRPRAGGAPAGHVPAAAASPGSRQARGPPAGRRT